ncbi:hypothetical protein [Halovivax asiaticus]|nr:hypothetical protein [Halovivax asiaticus]
MAQIPISSNIKGQIGEASILGNPPLPQPIVDELLEFLSNFYEIGDNPNPMTDVRRSVYFNATTQEGKEISWKADARITLSWVSAQKQEETEEEVFYPDMEAVFPVEVKTGEYATLERNQLDVARAISQAPNHVFPVVINVSIEDLPENVEIETQIFGRDFD